MTSRGGDALLNEMFWRSGYARPATLDVEKAEAVTSWGRCVARKSAPGRMPRPTPPCARPPRACGCPVEPRIGPGRFRVVIQLPPAGRRVGPAHRGGAHPFYRRVLAAWEFLETMGHGAALEQLRTLTALERTPLP